MMLEETIGNRGKNPGMHQSMVLLIVLVSFASSSKRGSCYWLLADSRLICNCLLSRDAWWQALCRFYLLHSVQL